MGLDIMASISEEIDFDTACLVAEELGARLKGNYRYHRGASYQ